MAYKFNPFTGNFDEVNGPNGEFISIDINGNLSVDSTGRVKVPLGTAALPSIHPGTDTNTGIFSPGADQVAISTNGTGRLFVDSAGKVGIGSTLSGNANNRLLVRSESASAITNVLLLNNGAANNNAGQGVRLNFSGISEVNSDIRYAYIEAATQTTGNDHYLAFGTNAPAVTPVERMRIDFSGRLLVGTSTNRLVTCGTSGGWDPRVQVTKTGIDAGNIAAYNFSTYAVDLGGGLGIGPDIVLARSNNNTEGTQTAIANNMLLGRITFNGSDGTAFQAGAFIAAASDGQTWASGDCPARLVFSVTGDGSASPTEAMRINNQREVLIGTTTRNANGGVLQLKSGITFPATAVAATDANTLDDYEEGTWTPVVTPESGGTFTTITTTGTYIKIGKKVTLLLYVDVVSVGTALGSWAIAGIPFGPSGTHTFIYGTGANLNTGVLVVYQIFTPGPNISIRPGTGSTLCATGTRVGAEITYITV